MPVILVDAASVYWRAYFALPDSITDSQGRPVNALRGFLDSLATMLENLPHQRVIACWDEDWRPQWRVDLVPSYKAHRLMETQPGQGDSAVHGVHAVNAVNAVNIESTPDSLSPQIPMIRQVLDALGIFVAAAPECEADDVIATYCQPGSRIARDISIVSGDRDLLQLVDEHTTMLYTGGTAKTRGGRPWLEFTPDAVEEKYGVIPARYADMATLRGDASDGLPGVPGIGEKTAVALVNAYGGVFEIMAAAGQSPGKPMTARLAANLHDAADLVAATYAVVALKARQHVPTPPPSQGPDIELAQALAREYGVIRSVERLLPLLPT
jgi:5'-3' exonuclease